MKKYLISLEKDSYRRELFFSQEHTADFQIFSAINTMQEAEENLNKRFNSELFLQKYHRVVTKGEIGCTLSHLAIYDLIVNDATIRDDEYCLICEDDALFSADFQYHLDAILKAKPKADILLIGQSKISAFDDIELEINYPTTFHFLLNKVENSHYQICYPYKNYYAGTVAYLIRKSSAKKFLEEVSKQKSYWLADDFILFGDKFELDIQCIRPLMVIENPILSSNLESMRGSISHSLWKKLLKYPLKKLLAVKQNLRKS